MPRKSEPQEEKLVKHLAVREFGDSLYVPLTSFCKKLGLNRGEIVTVELEGEKIVISKFKG